MLGWQQSELAIEAFEQKYRKLEQGATGHVPEDSIRPVDKPPVMEDVVPEFEETGSRLLEKAVMIKLNGGLGTSMGLDRSKSLLEARDGLTFLDIIARHSGARRAALILMNSAGTRPDSLEMVRKYPHIRKQEKSLPLDFEQSKTPKVDAETMLPAHYPANPDLEWCPAGHGDLFTAIQDQGVLVKLLETGYEYAFISNADNLCASLHPGILGYMAAQRIPFLMEVTRRTVSDRKGGHLARSAGDGSLLLRESAQCPSDDTESFQDIERHRYFNTNNIWINLRDLQNILAQNNGLLPLPLIKNEKHVNPVDTESPRVYQLESAMGAAISLFPGATALQVPRSRFLPVKSCEDLLLVRSDRLLLNTADYTLNLDPDCPHKDIRIKLDQKYYKFIEEWELAFPHGVPSLRDCSNFCLSGPFLFRENVTAVDRVTLVQRGEARVEIAAGTCLNGFYLE